MLFEKDQYLPPSDVFPFLSPETQLCHVYHTRNNQMSSALVCTFLVQLFTFM